MSVLIHLNYTRYAKEPSMLLDKPIAELHFEILKLLLEIQMGVLDITCFE